MLQSAGHDPETNTLEVRFKNGSTYRYSGVSAEAHAEFMAAESKGKHFGTHIKGKYECQKVEQQ